MTELNKVAVVGLGLIGGSLAAALKNRGAGKKIIGIARREETTRQALQMGIVDAAHTEIEYLASVLDEGDCVFIAVPTLTTRSIVHTLKRCLKPGVVVTDGASVKGSVKRDVIDEYGVFPANFVLAHPIAGSEKSGVQAANPDLYVDHRVIVTPQAENNPQALALVRQLWETVGAEVLEMSVDDHDAVLAATSHLPHAIAFSLVDTLAHDSKNENIFRYAAGGFRDFTRIASSDAVMWRDIMLANSDSVVAAIDLFASNLARLREAVAEGDGQALTGIFTRAKVARDRFTRMLEHKAYSNSMQNVKEKLVSYSVKPGGAVSGTVRVPGDKSISHRSIMLGSLAEGTTRIKGFLEGEDALATLQAFRDMGVVIEGPDEGEVIVYGVGLHGLQKPSGSLYMGNSGTSMRLLSGILAGQKFDSELSGDSSLSKRPMRRVADPLTTMGAQIDTAEGGRPPLKIHGSANLQGIHYDMPIASAQVKSCLLLAGLFAEGKTSVSEPAPTRDHTERMLSGFGYPVTRQNATVSLASGGTLHATNIDIPADISSATFFMVAAAIAPGSDITLTHVGVNPTRVGVINILTQMGADIQMLNQQEVGGEPVADIRIVYSSLKGIDIPEEQVPLAIDEFPAILIAAACAEGTTRLSGAEELRVKETDRIQAMADGLTTLGIKCETKPDGIIVEGGKLSGGSVESFHDHRIAMAFTVAALRANDTITVNNCANVATSFPNFVELARQVGISIEVNYS